MAVQISVDVRDPGCDFSVALGSPGENEFFSIPEEGSLSPFPTIIMRPSYSFHFRFIHYTRKRERKISVKGG